MEHNAYNINWWYQCWRYQSYCSYSHFHFHCCFFLYFAFEAILTWLYHFSCITCLVQVHKSLNKQFLLLPIKVSGPSFLITTILNNVSLEPQHFQIYDNSGCQSRILWYLHSEMPQQMAKSQMQCVWKSSKVLSNMIMAKARSIWDDGSWIERTHCSIYYEKV